MHNAQSIVHNWLMFGGMLQRQDTLGPGMATTLSGDYPEPA